MSERDSVTESANDRRGRFTGMRPPPPAPEDADALTVALHYLSFYEREFARTRELAKNKARRVTVSTAGLNSLIALTGVAVALGGIPWLGLISTGLAGIAGVIAAWDGIFRHHDLWQQRTVIVSELQRIKRTSEFAVTCGEDRLTVARETMDQLTTVLADDLSTWSGLERRYRRGRSEGQSAEKTAAIGNES